MRCPLERGYEKGPEWLARGRMLGMNYGGYIFGVGV